MHAWFKTSVLTLFSFYSVALQAQNRVPLSEKLQEIESNQDISFSYDDELIKSLTFISESKAESLAEELQDISKQTGLEFTLLSEKIILIELPKHKFCAQLIDNDTQLPIKDVQILINNVPRTLLSNANGSVEFSSRNTYQDSISFSHIGYRGPKVALKSLIADCPEVPLSFQELELDEVLITDYLTKGINSSKKDHSLSVKTSELALLPGETDGDVLLAIRALPGITSPNGKAGNLHLRGSTTDQTLIIFDGIPIYHKGHYLGAISPYNPIMVEEINIYRSGFTAELGGRVGGAIELKTDRRIPDSTRVGIGLNSYYASVFAKVPISDRFSVGAALRTSYMGEWNSPKLDAINEMVFTPSQFSIATDDPNLDIGENSFDFIDYNAISTYNMTSGQIQLSFLGIRNEQLFSFRNAGMNERNVTSSELENNGINLNWLHYWNPNVSSDISFTYGHYSYFSQLFSEIPNRPPIIRNEFNNDITDLKFKSVIEYSNNNDRVFSLGYEVNNMQVNNSNLVGNGPPPPGSPPPPGGPPPANGPTLPDGNSSELESFLHSAFVNYENRFLDKLILNAGIRSNYYSLTKEFLIEPRVSANFQYSPVTAFKTSYGLYSQYIGQNVFFDFDDIRVENLSWALADEDKPIIRSQQLMLGVSFTFPGLVIDTELYHKQVNDLTTVGSGRENPFLPGDLDIYGVDLLIRKQFGKLDAWVSYSFLNTLMDFPELNQSEFLTYYDQPHTFNFTGTLPINQWQFSIGWFISSGAPNYLNSTFFPEPGPTPLPDIGPIPDESNNGRFPAMHQLDAAVVYKFPNTKGWNASIGLSVLNVYDQQNLVEETVYSFGPQSVQAKRYNIGFAPNLMVNVSF